MDCGWMVPKGVKRNGVGLPSHYLINPRVISSFAEEAVEERKARAIKHADLSKMAVDKLERQGREPGSDG